MLRYKETIAFCCILYCLYVKGGVFVQFWKWTKGMEQTYSYLSIYTLFLYFHFTLWNVWSCLDKGNSAFTCTSSVYSHADHMSMNSSRAQLLAAVQELRFTEQCMGYSVCFGNLSLNAKAGANESWVFFTNIWYHNRRKVPLNVWI